MIESVFTGQSVDHGDYQRYLARVILSMSRLGGVILVGRGGNYILGANRGFHIRFVAPREKRIENLVKYKGMDKLEAAESIDRSDRERAQYIDKVFGVDIDDPSYYDLVVNSNLMDVEDMVEVVYRAVQAKFDKLRFIDHDQI
jgi:cytidylate kinase